MLFINPFVAQVNYFISLDQVRNALPQLLNRLIMELLFVLRLRI